MFAFQFTIWRVIYEELCVHRHSVIFILIVCIKSYDMKNIIPLILLFIPFTGLQSQTIRGRVVDSFTYEKLDSVTVDYVDKNDSVVLTSNMSGWSRWSFYDNLPKSGKYKLVIKTKGYEDKVIDNVSVRVMKGRMFGIWDRYR